MDKNQNMDWNEPLNKIITRFKKITPEGNLFYWGHLVTLGLAGTFVSFEHFINERCFHTLIYKIYK